MLALVAFGDVTWILSQVYTFTWESQIAAGIYQPIELLITCSVLQNMQNFIHFKDLSICRHSIPQVWTPSCYFVNSHFEIPLLPINQAFQKKKKGIHCLKYQYKSIDLASLPRSTHRSTCCILLKQPVYSRLVPFKQFNLRIFPRVRHVKICVNFFFTLVIRELYVFFFFSALELGPPWVLWRIHFIHWRTGNQTGLQKDLG